MHFSFIEYVTLSAVIVNLMCAGLLTVLLVFVPYVRERKLRGKYWWSIVGCLPVLYCLPMMDGNPQAVSNFYSTHVLVVMLPLISLQAVRHFRRNYGSLLQFAGDAWPVLLVGAVCVAAAVWADEMPGNEETGFWISAGVMLVGFLCGVASFVNYLKLHFDLEFSSTSTTGEQALRTRRERRENLLFLRVVIAEQLLLAVAVNAHWAERTEASYIMCVTAFTVCNVLLAVLILVNDATTGNAQLQPDDIQQWVEREIAERDAHYMKECRELCRRIDALEAHRMPPAGSGGAERPHAAHQHRRAKRKRQEVATPGAVETQILDALKAWIDVRGYCRHNLSLDGLAAQMGTNRSYLSRCINDRWGMGFSAFLTALRVREACRMMADDILLPMSSVAYRCGFNDGSSFTRCFKQVLHVTPSVWKERRAEPEIRQRTEALAKMRAPEGDGTDSAKDRRKGRLEVQEIRGNGENPPSSVNAGKAGTGENDGADDGRQAPADV